MKKTLIKLLTLFFCLSITSVSAQTIISDNINASTTWTSDNSPYVIESTIELASNATLTIEPGVVIKMYPFASINVSGTLIAQGTEQDRIVFTSYTDDEIGGDTNGDGDTTTPFQGEWLNIAINTISNNSILEYCQFKYGGSSFEIGAVELYGNFSSFSNCSFTNCAVGVNVSSSSSISLSDLTFDNNELGLLATSGLTSAHNCSFVNNFTGLANFSTSDVDATFNWWGIEDYILGNDNDTSNLVSITDVVDNFFYSKVLYFPMLLPPLTVESISPNKTAIATNATNITVLGYLFDSNAELYLEKGDVIINPSVILDSDSFSIQATFSWNNAETGLYDVVVVNPGGNDTLRLEGGFSLLDIDVIPFGEWVSFEVSSGTSFASSVDIPDSIDNLYVLVKKSSRIGYSSSWYGILKLNTDDLQLISSDVNNTSYVSTDMDFHITDPASGLYTFDIETITEQGTGEIIFTDSIPTLTLGNWTTGEILRPYGSDWKVIDIPSGQSDLFFRIEGFGRWSYLEVLKENLDSPSDRWIIDNISRDGYRIDGHIPNPTSGRYYLKYKDSAVLYGSYSPNDQQREYLIFADANPIVSSNLVDLIITELSTYELGQGISSFDINGAGFSSSDSIHLSMGSNIIAPIQKEFNDSLQIWNVTFDLTNANIGDWDLSILNATTTVDSPQPVSISAPELSDIVATVVTSNIIRAGRWRPFIIELANTSNVDAHLVPMNIQLSGAPQIRNNGSIQASADIWDDIDWSVFDGEWNSWNDVPLTIETEDSITGQTFTNLPLIFPYIKAGQTLRFELTLKYTSGSEFDYKVTVMNAIAIAEADDLGQLVFDPNIESYTGITECMEIILEALVKSMVDIILPGDVLACANGLTNAYSQLALKLLLSNDQKPVPVSGVATSFISAIGTCVVQIGSSTPAGKVIKAILEVIKILDGAQLLQDIYQECRLPNTPITGQGQIVGSSTPEDKYGIVGAEQMDNLPMSERRNFINQTNTFNYKIDYWNKATATAPAAEVFIRDTLDENFDLTTFNFTEIGFLRWSEPLEGGHYFNLTVDMRPDENYLVNIEGTLNPFTREVYWVHRTLDPDTYELPDDPFAGYLPPVDTAGYNLGWVNFSVEPIAGLPSETVFKNQARVNFDGIGPWGPAPPYGPYTNTFDFDKPESSVLPLDPSYNDTTFMVSWSGNDGDGANIAYYDIFVSENNGPFTNWLFRTSTTSAEFNGEYGKDYSFYSVAHDKVGNVEDAPNVGDASTSVLTGINELTKNEFHLYQNSPNPFDEKTIFKFRIPESNNVQLEIIDLNGRVTTILNERLSSGEHTIEWLPSHSIPKGVLFYRLRTESFSKTMRMIIL